MRLRTCPGASGYAALIDLPEVLSHLGLIDLPIGLGPFTEPQQDEAEPLVCAASPATYCSSAASLSVAVCELSSLAVSGLSSRSARP